MSTEPTSAHIRLSPQNTGLWNIVQDEAAAQCTGELLEKDLAVSATGAQYCPVWDPSAN